MDILLESGLEWVILAGMILGLAGLIVPVFPGITIIWGLALFYGIITGFENAGGWWFALITLLTVIGWLSDNLLMGAKARQSGARWSSIAIALGAGFIFSLVLTPIGGIVACLVALFAAEYSYRRNTDETLLVVRDMLIGWGWAFIVRFGLGTLIIIVWGIWAW